MKRTPDNSDIFGDNGLNNRLIGKMPGDSQRIAAGEQPAAKTPTHGLVNQRAKAPAGLEKLPAVKSTGISVNSREHKRIAELKGRHR